MWYILLNDTLCETYFDVNKNMSNQSGVTFEACDAINIPVLVHANRILKWSNQCVYWTTRVLTAQVPTSIIELCYSTSDSRISLKFTLERAVFCWTAEAMWMPHRVQSWSHTRPTICWRREYIRINRLLRVQVRSFVQVSIAGIWDDTRKFAVMLRSLDLGCVISPWNPKVQAYCVLLLDYRHNYRLARCCCGLALHPSLEL